MTVKLISHTGECHHDDDPSLLFRLELIMSAPQFMVIAFIGLYGGTEDVVARADTARELKDWMHEKGLCDHPRLKRWRITGPEGIVAQHRWDRS